MNKRAKQDIYFNIENDFLWFLIALGLLLFIPSFIEHDLAKDVSIYSFLLASMATGIISAAVNKRHFRLGLAFGGICFLANLPIYPFLPYTAIFILRMGGLIVFFTYISIMVFIRISQHRISFNIILGAIVGYLLMGTIGGFWCRLIEYLYPGSFGMPDGMEAQVDTLTYFSFVTMSSLGYGDMTPATAQGRSVALFLTILGQMYMAISVAILISKYSVYNKK
ncbi:MAG: two pore domain potassium channel family protein [Aureispira sp.]|nr:two pore domain potassium channel family protein [Aureispira sp.]